MRLPSGERPLRTAGNSSAIATTATSLKADFLSRIARWASAVVPPLGSLFGIRLARTCEKAGVSIPFKLQCQRCASVLELGVNCSLREGDRLKRKVYVCDYCGYRNTKGSVKKKKAPSTSGNSTRKKKRKGWSSLKDLAVKGKEPALKMSLTMGTGTGEVVDNGKVTGTEVVVCGDKSGEADFKLSALRKVVDMDARISEVEAESTVPPPTVIHVEDDEPVNGMESEQPQVVSVIMEAIPGAVEPSPVTVTLSSKALVEEEVERVPETLTEAEIAEKAEKVVLTLDDDAPEQTEVLAEVQTTATTAELENVCASLEEPEKMNLEEEMMNTTNMPEEAKDTSYEVCEVHVTESGREQEMVDVEGEERIDAESERLDQQREPEPVDENLTENKDEEMLDVKGSETTDAEPESEHLLERHESEDHFEKVSELDGSPSNESEPKCSERESSPRPKRDRSNIAKLKKRLRYHERSAISILKSVMRATRYARNVRTARFNSYLGVLRRHCKKVDAHWRKKLEQVAKEAVMEKERADKAVQALCAVRSAEKTSKLQLSCVPALKKKVDKVSDDVHGLRDSVNELTQEFKKHWAAVSKVASLASEPKEQPMVQGEDPKPQVAIESNVEATTPTEVDAVQAIEAAAEVETAPSATESTVRRKSLGVSKLSKRIKKKKKPFCSPVQGCFAMEKVGRRWRLTQV